jgi:hypothetical protein
MGDVLSLFDMNNWLTKAHISYLVGLCFWPSKWFSTLLSTELYTNRGQLCNYDM